MGKSSPAYDHGSTRVTALEKVPSSLVYEAIIERCAGLDVHQATVVACVLIGEAGRKPHKEIRTFSTMTRDLEAMRDWLKGPA